jgi:hypothetical protein
MWAHPQKLLCHVAVPAQHLQSGRPSFVSKLLVEGGRSYNASPPAIFVAIVVDVIQAEEDGGTFITTGTLATVCGQSL